MKKAMVLILAFFIMSGIPLPALCEATPPISSGTVNKTTIIYWGKGEQFPILATVNAGEKLDVYEYDANWVLVLYKTYVTSGGEFSEHSFYGYIKRSDITCDPPLSGDASARADTGPGKKKGKRPKPIATSQPAEPTPAPTKAPTQTEQPDVTVEPMEEFDWIIRTEGLQVKDTRGYSNILVTCSFSLMAQKAGGSAASSDPAFNGGMHVPYAAMAFLSLKWSAQETLTDFGVNDVTGTGGLDMNLQASGVAFYLDTGVEDFALVGFSLPMRGSIGGAVTVTGEAGSAHREVPVETLNVSINIQLKKSGAGYQLALSGLPAGVNGVEFPAILEKTFADPDRFDKEAAEADARRKKAEAERDKWLEEQKQKAEEAAKATEYPLAPLTPTEDPLAPLTPTEDPLAPLTPTGEPLAPLTPSQEDEAPPFPSPSGRLERRNIKCA
jgi:hypothetical protein